MQRALSSRIALVMMVNVTVTLTSLLTEVGGLSFAAAADDSTVWELKPYRICALLVADWSPAWSDEQLAQYARAIQRRGSVEIGRPWQLSVTAAPLPLRRTFLSATSPEQIPHDSELLESYRDVDKVIVVFLRMSGVGDAMQAWELDWASKRWSVGGLRHGIRQSDVTHAAFEMLSDAVSPLAMVKLASGARVVLRERAALLPTRNPRRQMVRNGSVFEVVMRDSDSGDSLLESPILLVVEKIDDQGIACRATVRGKNPWESLPPDAWLAVGVRARHANTTFRLMLADGPDTGPLTGCDVWLADRLDRSGVFAGHVSSRGEVNVPSQGSVQWLHVKVGSITLFSYPVFVGAESVQTIRSNLSPNVLLESAVLTNCRDDVAELIALRDTYVVRHQHRIEAGREAEAATLWDEMRNVIKPRAEGVSEEIRNRRHAIMSSGSSRDDRCGPHWTELSSQLSELERQVAAETKASPEPVESGDVPE